jgi:purine-binding chemotaxis protein CheW
MNVTPYAANAREVKTEKKGILAGKYLSFFLNAEEYGLEILKVQEIIGRMPITPVPRTPGFIRGVINLRGKIIPIMDLKAKFGMDATRITDETCIIVTRTATLEMGVLVDRVSEVANIAAGEIENTPDFGADVDTRFLMGMGKTAGRVRLLLDIEKVMSTGDVLHLKNAAGADEPASQGQPPTV